MEGDPQSQAPAAAEQQAPAAATPPASVEVASAPSERKQLASFSDALRAQAETPASASKGDEPPSKPADSDPSGASAAPASKPDGEPAGAVTTPTTDQKADGASAEGDQPEASKPEADKGPSRRGAAKEIEALTSERDQLRAEVESLRASTVIPDHIKAAAIDARLPDDEFARLETKLKRQDLTGDYLTVDEQERYNRALQVREWSGPWYQDAEQRAAEWVQSQQREIFDSQAKALAPVLKESDFLKPDPISRAQSWEDVYRYIRDASVDAGRALERAELQPKLDEAIGRTHDLEAELASLRTGAVGRGRPLERGGQSGGAATARPDFRTSSASDLFGAAIEQSDRRRSRRAPVGAR